MLAVTILVIAGCKSAGHPGAVRLAASSDHVRSVAHCLTRAGIAHDDFKVAGNLVLPEIEVAVDPSTLILFTDSPAKAKALAAKFSSGGRRGTIRLGTVVFELTGLREVDQRVRACII